MRTPKYLEARRLALHQVIAELADLLFARGLGADDVSFGDWREADSVPPAGAQVATKARLWALAKESV